MMPQGLPVVRRERPHRLEILHTLPGHMVSPTSEAKTKRSKHPQLPATCSWTQVTAHVSCMRLT